VFGAEQNTQDVFNPDELKELINRSVITKTFEEVVGKDLYTIHQHNIKMNVAEEALYEKAIKEFYSMKHLFNSTGNVRKDRMLEIIQQITLLLSICRHPNTYKEYNSLLIPSKYEKVLDLCTLWKDERVAVGVRTLKEVEQYKNILQKSNRNIYVITGSASMDKRKEIIEELRLDLNGILLSTQQSLSVSVDIEFIDKIICCSVNWTWASLMQWAFRFIRYHSTNNKEIHIISYKDSIEVNLLSLLMAKEKLTLFMKNQEIEDSGVLYERFGITFNLIDMLLTKTKDRSGKIKITHK
jgi:superfamily II DNA or RNA helicase